MYKNTCRKKTSKIINTVKNHNVYQRKTRVCLNLESSSFKTSQQIDK